MIPISISVAAIPVNIALMIEVRINFFLKFGLSGAAAYSSIATVRVWVLPIESTANSDTHHRLMNVNIIQPRVIGDNRHSDESRNPSCVFLLDPDFRRNDGDSSYLLDFNQCAAKIFGVEKQNRFPMRADFRFTIAKHPRTTCLQFIPRG